MKILSVELNGEIYKIGDRVNHVDGRSSVNICYFEVMNSDPEKIMFYDQFDSHSANDLNDFRMALPLTQQLYVMWPRFSGKIENGYITLETNIEKDGNELPYAIRESESYEENFFDAKHLFSRFKTAVEYHILNSAHES